MWWQVLLSVLVGIAVLGIITIWSVVHYFNRLYNELEELKHLEDDECSLYGDSSDEQ